MIALDTSAVVAIAMQEPEEAEFSREIVREEAIIGAPTLLECAVVLSARMPAFAEAFIRSFVQRRSVRCVDFTLDMYEAAAAAFARYGKGRGHPARLNFGDCLAYAVAKRRNVPLLFKGDDFSHTDIRAAAPRRIGGTD